MAGKRTKHPDENIAKAVQQHAAVGTPYQSIAKMVGCSNSTLLKHYQGDLDIGLDKANAVVGGVIFNAAKAGQPWACKLWAGRRMQGWQPTLDVNQTVNNTTNVQVNVQVDLESRLKNLSPEQRDQLESLVNTLAEMEDGPVIEGNLIEFPG